MKVFIKTLFALCVLTLIVIGVSPYYQLYRLKTAYERADYATITQSINFEVLRPNLKREAHDRLEAFLNGQNLAPLAIIGLKPMQIHNVGVRLVDNAIDKAITKDNLNKLLAGEITKDSEALLAMMALGLGLVDIEKLVADYLQTGDIQSAISAQQVAIAQKATKVIGKPTNPKVGYCAFDCFYIKTTLKDKPITVIMHRHRLIYWQIDSLILP